MSMANEADGSLTKDLSRLQLAEARTGGSAAHDQRLQRTVKNHHNERDITDFFKTSCQDLRTDELVKQESFALFEAVSALEITDGKVDVGVCDPSESYFDELEIQKPLSSEQILGVMDQIICLEVMWHQGIPLSQSIFTSLHIDYLFPPNRRQKEVPTFRSLSSSLGTAFDIPDLTELVLRAYCLGVVKGCDMIIELVVSREYQEEEDLCTNTYGRDLYPDIEDNAVVKELDASLGWIDSSKDMTDEIKHALSLRLRVRRDFLTAFLAQQGQNHFERWQGIENGYKDILRTHSLASEVPQAFSEKVLRKLPGNVPPRKLKSLSFNEACESHIRLCNDTQEALRVLEFDSTVPPEVLFDFLWPFTSRSHLPSAFARAVLQAHFVAPNHLAGPNEINQLLFNELNRYLSVVDEIRSEYWDVETPAHPHFKIVKLVERFFLTVGLPYEKIFRAMCQNRTRIRRGFTNAMEEISGLPEELIPALGQEITEEETKDPEKASFAGIKQHFSVVISTTCNRLATWITQLGIEQDLYESYEMAGMYCWITLNSRGICDRLGDFELTIRNEISRSYATVSEDETLINIGKADAIATSRLRWEATSSLAEAIWMIYALLLRTSHLAPPSSPYTSPLLQHELRFRPYLRLHRYLPVPSSFASWSTTTSQPLSEHRSNNSHNNANHQTPASPADFLNAADIALARARAALTTLLKHLKAPEPLAGVYDVGASKAYMRDEATRALRVAVTARLSVGAVSKILEEAGSTSGARSSKESMKDSAANSKTSKKNKKKAPQTSDQSADKSTKAGSEVEAQRQIAVLKERIKRVEMETSGAWVLPKIVL